MTQLTGGGCVGFSTAICQHGHFSYLVQRPQAKQNQVAGNRAASASTDSPADTFQPGCFSPLGWKTSLTRGLEIARRHTR
jgi:hypothetical protein